MAALAIPAPRGGAIRRRDFSLRSFQQTLNACASPGGGTVSIPAGDYLIGSIAFKSNTTLRFAKGAILLGSPDLDDYPAIDVRWEGRWIKGHRALLYAGNAAHVAIVGPERMRGNSALGDARCRDEPSWSK